MWISGCQCTQEAGGCTHGSGRDGALHGYAPPSVAQAELAAVVEQQAALPIDDEPAVAAYFSLCASMDAIREAMRGWVTRPEFALPFLQVRLFISMWA